MFIDHEDDERIENKQTYYRLKKMPLIPGENRGKIDCNNGCNDQPKNCEGENIPTCQ